MGKESRVNIFNTSWFGRKQNPQANDLTSSKSKAVTEWVQHLPKDNINIASDLLHNALAFLQRSLMATIIPAKSSKLEAIAAEWLNNLESIRPEIEVVCTQLHQRYIADTDKSPSFRRNLMTQIFSLQMDLGKLYYEYSLHGLCKTDHTYQGTAIQRALHHFTAALYHSLLISYPVPKSLWQLIYALYQKVEQAQLQHMQVSDPLQAEGLTLTLNDNLKIPLLLASANPYELHPSDLTRLYHCLPHWASQVALHTHTLDNDLYCFMLNTDNPPQYHDLHTSNDHNLYTRSINLVALVEYLRHDATNTHLAPTLLNHLETIWEKMPIRRFPREIKTGSLQAVIGLEPIHYFLEAETGYEASRRKTHPGADSIIRGFSFHIPDLNSHTPDATSPFPETPQQGPHYTHKWHLMNISEKGYCLCTTENYPRFIEPGELIAFQEHSDPGNLYWHIGAIQWLTNTEEHKMQIGIQLLSPTSTAVTLQNSEQLADNSHSLALFLPPIASLDQAQSIVISLAAAYTLGEKIRMVNQHIDSDIVLEKELEATSFYKRCSFRIVA
jgi:hypothetical protein